MAVTKTLFDSQPEAQDITRLECRELTLKNFKGIKELTVQTPPKGMDVYGRNATGKSTLADAFMYLLFGKDSQNRTDFEIKTLAPDGEPIHHLDHEVSATFRFRGRVTTLKKVYTEKWTQKRGESRKELTGHETAYFIDGVPKKKAEYEEFIRATIDEKAFRLLTDPSYFNEQLHWTERRKILLEIAGGVTDEEVIAADPSLEEFPAILGDLTIDNLKAKLDSERKATEKELKQIPPRISEARRSLPNIEGAPLSLDEDIAKAQALRKEKTEELVRAEQGRGVAEKVERLSQVRSEMSRMEMEAREKAGEALSNKRTALQDAQYAAKEAERDAKLFSDEADERSAMVKELDAKLDSLRSKWDEVDAEEFTCSVDTVCPTCEQTLPECKVEEARQKALEAFNLQKSERLEAITKEGKATKERKEQLEKVAARQRQIAADDHKKLGERQALCAKLQAELSKMSGPVTVTSKEYTALAIERDALERAIEDMKSGAKADLSGLRSEIDALDVAIEALRETKAQFAQKEAVEKRIAELEAQEKRLSSTLETTLKHLSLCSNFEKAQARLLEERVKPFFRLAEFKLFDQQVNGTLAPCCETLYQGVPYATGLNRGMRTNVGLDIIATLQKHLRLSAPVWIDNAEAVTDLTPVDAQVIRLIVSRPDKTLRFVNREED